MLESGFYTTNATTMLLWLFQNCNHEVLLGLIALGALCVVVSVLVVVFRTVVVISFLARFLVCIFAVSFISIFRYVVWTRGLLRLLRPSTSQAIAAAPRAANSDPISLALARGSSLPRSISDSQRLSLPQSLALHPNQWSEIEASSSMPVASIADSFRAPAPSIADTPRVEAPRPLRRSNRLRARHVRLRDTCFCSS